MGKASSRRIRFHKGKSVKDPICRITPNEKQPLSSAGAYSTASFYVLPRLDIGGPIDDSAVPLRVRDCQM